jgi:hypothetical protein
MTLQDKEVATYRRRAEVLRAEATHANHPDTKRALMSISESYTQLAMMIEERGNPAKL